MVTASSDRRMVLAGLCVVVITGGPAQAGDWRARVTAALAANPATDRGVSHLDLTVDGADLALRYSRDVPAFMAELAAIEARAPTEGPGYGFATGTNRFAQRLVDGRASLTEHWMGHDGVLRLVMVATQNAAQAAGLLEDFTGFREGGGFGGPPLRTPPLTAPQD